MPLLETKCVLLIKRGIFCKRKCFHHCVPCQRVTICHKAIQFWISYYPESALRPTPYRDLLINKLLYFNCFSFILLLFWKSNSTFRSQSSGFLFSSAKSVNFQVLHRVHFSQARLNEGLPSLMLDISSWYILGSQWIGHHYSCITLNKWEVTESLI